MLHIIFKVVCMAALSSAPLMDDKGYLLNLLRMIAPDAQPALACPRASGPEARCHKRNLAGLTRAMIKPFVDDGLVYKALGSLIAASTPVPSSIKLSQAELGCGRWRYEDSGDD
jgi:hypothetical protein